MAGSPYTEADRALSAKLAEVGFKASPRAIQDWRRKGLIDHEVRSLGPWGTEVRYPTQALAQADEACRLLRLCGRAHLVVLALFGVGRTPTERALRDALKWVVDQFVKAGTRTLANEGTPALRDQVRRGSSSMSKQLPEVAASLREQGSEEAKTLTAWYSPLVGSRVSRENTVPRLRR